MMAETAYEESDSETCSLNQSSDVSLHVSNNSDTVTNSLRESAGIPPESDPTPGTVVPENVYAKRVLDNELNQVKLHMQMSQTGKEQQQQHQQKQSQQGNQCERAARQSLVGPQSMQQRQSSASIKAAMDALKNYDCTQQIHRAHNIQQKLSGVEMTVSSPSPEKDKGAIEEELEAATEQLQALKTKHYLLTMENNCHREMIKSLETQTDQLQEEIATRSRSEVRLAGMVNELTAQRAALQESQREEASVYKLVEEIRAELHRLQNSKLELEAVNRSLDVQNKKLASAEDDKSKLIWELGAKNKLLETRLEDASSRMRELESTCSSTPINGRVAGGVTSRDGGQPTYNRYLNIAESPPADRVTPKDSHFCVLL